MHISVSSDPHQYLLWSVLLTAAILVGVKQYVSMAFIYFSLTISDAEHLFMCFLAICILSLEKCLFRPFVHFLVGLSFWVVLCILYTSSLYMWFMNISSHSVDLLLSLGMQICHITTVSTFMFPFTELYEIKM